MRLPPGLLLLIVVGVALELTAHSVAGPHALPFVGVDRLARALAVASGTALSLLLLNLLESVWRVRAFVAPSGQVRVADLWRSITVNPAGGLLIALVSAYSITGCANLAEYYRINAALWYDPVLWRLEESVFSALLGSWLDAPRFWDAIYFLLWQFLFLTQAVLIRRQRIERLALLSIAAVIAFYLTRTLAIGWPTAGPAFHRPELFDLAGTTSAWAQEMLREYMAGNVPQNGLIPGTMAMPSLHVGLTGLAAWSLAREARWTLWLTAPWLALIWASTVLLGWHYAVDGIGGLLVAAFSLGAAQFARTLVGRLPTLSPGIAGARRKRGVSA